MYMAMMLMDFGIRSSWIPDDTTKEIGCFLVKFTDTNSSTLGLGSGSNFELRKELFEVNVKNNIQHQQTKMKSVTKTTNQPHKYHPGP